MREFLSTGGAAKLLGLSRERVGQLVRDGKLAVAACDSNGRLLLRRGVVERFRKGRKGAKASMMPQEAQHEPQS